MEDSWRFYKITDNISPDDISPDDILSYKFATTLIFTNGKCGYCKEQVYEIDGLNLKVDIEKGKEHYKRHKKQYKIVEELGL